MRATPAEERASDAVVDQQAAADPAAAALRAVRGLLAPIAAERALEVCDVAWTSEGGARTLRITIERPLPEGTPWRPELGFGVTLEDCAQVSRALSAALDEGDAISFAYQLEVSSPGLDRPLRSASDHRRFVGALAKLKLEAPLPDGQRVLRGILEPARPGEVAILVDGRSITVPLDQVASGQLVFEMPTAAKRAPATRAGGGAAKRADAAKGKSKAGRA